MKIIIFSALVFLSSCAPSLYYATTDTTFKEVENEDHIRKLIYLDQNIASLSKLDSISTFINEKRWMKLHESIKTLNKQDQIFFTAIEQLLTEEFEAAYKTLESLNNTAYNCQVGVLRTDCQIELEMDSKNYKSKYQDAMNCTENEKVKSIINTRYRFLRYAQ